jgi:uncharacterized protein YeaO (DUF488 family)
MELAKSASKENLTLIYSAKDKEHNNAVALKKLIENHLKQR